MNPEFFMFNDGQIMTNIFDCYGNFYLIHPFENSIKRNILNNIIYYNNKKKNNIPIKKFVYLINYLYSKNLIINTEHNLYNNIILSNGEGFVKTELGAKIEELEMTIPDALTMISAAAMGCLTEIYEINIFIQIIGSLPNIVSINSTWKKFKEIYGNIKSDIIFIYSIIQKLRKNFSHLYLFNLNSSNVDVILLQHYNTELIKFIKLSSYLKEPPADYDVLLWNKLKKLKNNGILDNETSQILKIDNRELIKFKKLSSYLNKPPADYDVLLWNKLKKVNEIIQILKIDKSTLNIIESNINANKKDIITWAERSYLNSDIILNVLKKLGEYYLTKDVINSKSAVFNWAQELSSNYNKYLTEYTIEERIIRSFLYGKSYQFTFKLDKSNSYLQTFLNYNILTINIKKNRFGEEETLTNITNNIMFYLNYTENDKIKTITGNNEINISFVNQIEPVWLIPTAPLFFNCTFNDIIKETEKNDNTLLSFIKSRSFKRIQNEIANNWNQDFNIWDSDKTPILKNFYKMITKTISRINNN